MTINRFSGKWAFLSNFYPSPLVINNLTFPTVEHAFQSFKMTSSADFHKVRGARSPGYAKKLARSLQLRDDWELVKDQIMYDCCKIKFYNEALRTLLIGTGDCYLEEGNTWGDRYWGVCAGEGLNKLGLILIRIREESK